MKGQPTASKFRFKPRSKIGQYWYSIYSYQSKRHIYRILYRQDRLGQPIFMVGSNPVIYPEEMHKEILKHYDLN